jgi:KaiC/GvpD/RAD55 family RecA-like ATPase
MAQQAFDVEELLRTSGKKPIPLDLSIYRTPSGIPGLDEMVEGGFEKGSVLLLVGIPGSGKTTFALQFLHYGATQLGEPGLFITFSENKESIYRHALSFGWDFAKLEKEKKFQLLQFKPHQISGGLEEDGGAISDEIKSLGAKRLVIDSITAYTLLFKDEYQKRESIVSFIDRLHEWKCTSLIISEMPPIVSESQEGSIGFLSDAIIALHYTKPKEYLNRMHSLEVLKMRGTKHSSKLCSLSFESSGLAVQCRGE